MNSATGTKKTVGFGKALVVFICVFVLILCGINVLGTSAHIPLVIATIVATIAGVSSGFTWDEMEKGMSETIKASAPAILIMLIIGMVVGTWMLGGIIPTMIYYGLTWLSPKIFLFAACALCVMVSTFTGSSWTTMGTLSDTTNLAPAMAGTTVFTHVKHMVVTAGPSIIISLIIYAIMGFTVVKGTASMETIDLYMGTLKEFFTISPVMLIPPLCVLLMVIFKVPAIPGLIGVSALGGIFAAIFQKANLATILASMYTGVSMDTGVAEINRLVNRGGLSSMLDTVALILIALAFAGVVETTGAVHAIIEKILSKAKSDKAMMTTAIFATLFTNFATAAQYVAIVLPGRMFREAFRERGLHPKNLSRILEDVGTICAPFCPWSTDGVYILATLGCATAAYAPYMFFSMLCPIVSLICIWTGWTITRITPEQAKEDIIP